jgi:hypothetical protein
MEYFSPAYLTLSFITIRNGSTIPISYRGTSTLSVVDTTFCLSSVLITPSLVRNLLSVRLHS